MFDRAADLRYLKRAHRGIADEDRFPVRAVGVHDIPGRRPFVIATPVLPPDTFVEEIMEVIVFQMFELGAHGGKKLFGDTDKAVHRSADIEHGHHLDLVLPFRPHFDIQHTAVMGGGLDRGVEIEFVLCAFAHELAQPAQGHFHVARAKLDIALQVSKIALLPHLGGAFAAAVATDPDPGRITPGIPER